VNEANHRDGGSYDPEQLLTIHTVESTVALVYELEGELDTYTSHQLRAALMDGLERAAGRPVIVDLSRLSFFGSAGIGTLAECADAANARPEGGTLRLVAGDNHIVNHPIQATALNTLLPAFSSLNDAVSA